MIIIGIDPGVSGAAALVNHCGLLEVFDLPVTRSEADGRTKSKLDGRDLAVMLREALRRLDGATESVEIWLEDVHAMPAKKSGSGANSSLMHSKGVIEGVAGALGYPVFLVGSRKWKGLFGADADKANSISLALKLYPDAPITLKKHHNRAEALLIARYGLRERF